MSPPLRNLLFLLGCAAAGCGPSIFDTSFDLDGKGQGPSCSGETCDGCCLGGKCVEAAKGCGGSACFSCLGGNTAAPAPAATSPSGTCTLACSGRHACIDGACVREVGRTCTPGEVCALGTSCRAVEGYHTLRCWPDCTSGVCPSGMACEPAHNGRPTCVPIPRQDDTARFELRQLAFVDPEAATYYQTPWKAVNYQQCYDGAAEPTNKYAAGTRFDLCLPTRVGSPAPEFRHRLSPLELARLKVEVWQLDATTALPGCEMSVCSEQHRYHDRLAAASPTPPDLRPDEGTRSQTFSVPLVDPNGSPSHLQLHVLVEQVR